MCKENPVAIWVNVPKMDILSKWDAKTLDSGKTNEMWIWV